MPRRAVVAFSPGTVRAWSFVRRLAPGFLGANLLCVGLAALAGGAAHVIAAHLTPEIYSLAIGDHVLPSSPFESYLWGPLFIGALVSWWFGFVAAPAVYAAIVLGPRPSWGRPLLWFVSIGLLGWLASTFSVAAEHPETMGSEFGTNTLLALLGGRGYVVLALAFAALTISRWRGREDGEPPPADGKAVPGHRTP